MAHYTIFDAANGQVLGAHEYNTAEAAARDLMADAFDDPQEGRGVVVHLTSECWEDGGFTFGPETGGQAFRPASLRHPNGLDL